MSQQQLFATQYTITEHIESVISILIDHVNSLAILFKF